MKTGNTGTNSNRAADIILRLEREAKESSRIAEIFAQYKDGGLSANQAAIEAGYRQKKVSVTSSVDGYFNSINRELSATQQSRLYDQLGEIHHKQTDPLETMSNQQKAANMVLQMTENQLRTLMGFCRRRFGMRA